MRHTLRDTNASRLVPAVGSVCLALLCTAAAAGAQTFHEAEPGQTPGWVFTPTFVFSLAHDDNVTLAGHRSPTLSDTMTVLTPSGDAQYRGRHNWFGFGYDGSWSLYRQLNELNTFDQTLRVDTRHDLSRRVSLSLHDAFSIHPTTDVVQLSGVPFLRTGSRMNDGRAELRVRLAPHTSVSGSYATEWVHFEANPEFGRFLYGGTAHSFTGNVEHQLGRRLSVGAVYSFRRAILSNNPGDVGNSAGGLSNNAGHVDSQDGSGTVVYRPSPTITLSGALGVARLYDAINMTSRIGPSLRAGFDQRLERVSFSAGYSRSYVPSFGIGGTVQNEELNASVRMPLARNRLYWQGGLSWRRNEPLVLGPTPQPIPGVTGATLKSLWLQNWVGYAVQRWLRIEAFYWRSQQDSQLAGGRVDRNRVGVQLVTAMPMRIQ